MNPTSAPQSHLHPHHVPLPASQQPTERGKAAASAYEEAQKLASNMAPRLALTDLLPLPSCATKIPRLGFGVYLSPENTCVASCLHALQHGYRHIDTAQYYRNEAQVGAAVRRSGLRRADVFLTTKILAAGGSAERSYDKCRASVEKMDPGEEGYVDLFLIHSPNAGREKRMEMWAALERLYREGRVKSIGVSNYGVGHIEEMKGYAEVWPPHVNQIELHPWCQQRTIVDYCAAHAIVVEAYSPLVRNQKAHDATLASVAKQLGRTPSQVLIRYGLEKGWVPLPKSDTPARIAENADVFGFALGAAHLAALDGLDRGEEGAIVQAVRNELLK